MREKRLQTLKTFKIGNQMAEFIPPFERMLINEGGMVLHTVKNDKGGQTFAGIARNRWPNWAGWLVVDDGGTPHVDLVRSFYRTNFWNAMKLDEITNQDIARTLFDFGVNAGTSTAVKLAQIVVGATPDGSIGPKTLALINEINPDLFMARFSLAKLARYEQIVTKDKTQRDFLLGWVRRVLKESV